MLESLFTFLLKLSPVHYEEGRIVLMPGGSMYLFAGLLFVLAAMVIAVYVRSAVYPAARTRVISGTLRVLALVLLLLPFFEPTLMYPDVAPNETFVAVLVDNSDSMGIPDGSIGETRADDAAAVLYGDDRGIVPELERNFNVRYYSFSAEAARADSLGGLVPNGRETNLSAALTRVMSDFRGLPLTGIVLATDGGDNSSDDARSVAEELRGLGIPLHIVGLGEETVDREREILSVTANAVEAEGSGVEIEVRAKSWAEERRPATVSMYSGGRLVMSREMDLSGNGRTDTDSFYYWPEEPGVAQYTLQLEPAAGEVNIENNAADILIDAAADSVRVLYVEGYLRTDFKFIKRALEDDQVLDFASVTRTGTGKFYRQGIRSTDELTGGFPSTEEELFGYRAIILGDIEASFFSLEQMAMIERFVSLRGGGFLMLGGRHSFAEGDYMNTPIADLLPVKLDARLRSVIPEVFEVPGVPEEEQGFQFIPTLAGLSSPILKMSEEPAANNRLWEDVPRLTTINHLGEVKPGATVLAEKPEDMFGDVEPLLVVQRYGKGRTAALATASSWRWQMLLDQEDTRHERFWRQFVRWLSTETPDRVNINLKENRFEPGEEVPIRVSVFDADFNPSGRAEVTGTVTDPYGGTHEIAFFPDLGGEGEYASSFVAANPGVYTIDVIAGEDGGEIGHKRSSILSNPSKKEFSEAVLDRDYLEHLASLNDGYYYEPSRAQMIPENLTTRGAGTSIFRYESIWDTPLMFLLAVLVLSAEWLYRRSRGLP